MVAAVSYLKFEEVKDTGKTKVFSVESIQGGDRLGSIKWHAPWRRYVLFPSSNVLFDSNCLLEICSFIGRLMLDRIESKYQK